MPLQVGGKKQQQNRRSCESLYGSVQSLAGRLQASHRGAFLHSCQSPKTLHLMPLKRDREALRACQDILEW